MTFSLLSNHRRLPHLVVTRALAASFLLGGCVPATQYEQANSAAEVEREGHRRAVAKMNAAQEELKRVQKENEALAAQKAELEGQLQSEETAHAQASLDMEGAKKDREQQAELVTQLRGELARIGDHLKVYQGDKDLLEEKLQAAEGQVKLLESQIEYLRSQQETSEDAQEKLRGALADLAALQKNQGEEESTEDTEDNAAPDDAKAPGTEKPAAEEPAAEESQDDTPDEVMPEENSADDSADKAGDQ